jgi:hypothetical protein
MKHSFQGMFKTKYWVVHLLRYFILKLVYDLDKPILADCKVVVKKRE